MSDQMSRSRQQSCSRRWVFLTISMQNKIKAAQMAVDFRIALIFFLCIPLHSMWKVQGWPEVIRHLYLNQCQACVMIFIFLMNLSYFYHISLWYFQWVKIKGFIRLHNVPGLTVNIDPVVFQVAHRRLWMYFYYINIIFVLYIQWTNI